MSKRTYSNSTISDFPDGFTMVLPDGYRIDTEYDDDFNAVYRLRGGFYTNDDGEEDFAFSGSFITLNVDLKVKEDADPKALENVRNPAHPDFAFNQVAEGVLQNLNNQFGPGKILKLYKSFPASAVMKFYKPLSLLGVTFDTYVLFYWVQVSENTIFGFNSVYRNNPTEADNYYKHLLNVIKSVHVNGKPVDIGKLTPKKLEKALDMDTDVDVEALDLGLSIGVNIKNGDEETNYTINSDGSITSDADDGISYTSPDESLYPHYNSMLRSQGLGMLGLNVVVNQTGTEYRFYNLEEDIDEDAADELKDAVSTLNDIGASTYRLADRAKEMMSVFHVSPEVFDTAHDRECELHEGMMHRAYMMSALRSFAWTLTKYCDAMKKNPADLALDQIQSIIDTIADSNWLNYDNKSVCLGLCGTQDLHVYYLPENTPESIKAVFKPSQEEIDQTKQIQEQFPNYNPILSQIGSLDKLRADLEYIHPAIEKIFEDLKANRNYNEALTGNDADVLYGWCALSYAARGPFFSEDGPTMNYFSQIENAEEKHRRLENKRTENEKKFLKEFGDFYEKDPHIEFANKKFVLAGFWLPEKLLESEPDYKSLIEDRGGLTRTKVSGVTDYLVVEAAGFAESDIKAAIEQQKNNKPVKIIRVDDLRKALGLKDTELETSTAVSAATHADVSLTEETDQVFEETVIVDDSWAVIVPGGFKYSTDKKVIGNHRNIIIMEDKPDNDFEDPFGATISFTSMFNESENDGMDGVAMAKMMVGFMGVKDNKIVKDDQDLYVSYYYEPNRSYKEAGEKLDVHHIKVGTIKGVSSIQVFFSNSPLTRREQTSLVEKVAKSIRLSKPGELNEKHSVSVSRGKTEEANKPTPSASNPFGQPKKSISKWSFRAADTSKVKTKLISNKKGYAVGLLSLSDVEKEDANLKNRYNYILETEGYFEKLDRMIELADKCCNKIVTEDEAIEIKRGLLRTSKPIHALRSLIWTTIDMSGDNIEAAVSSAPNEMWLEMAKFIYQKGYVNYKPFDARKKEYGSALLRQEEVRSIYYYNRDVYNSPDYYKDPAIGKTMTNASHNYVYDAIDLLTDFMPAIEAFYDDYIENDDPQMIAIQEIIKGWCVYAYACRYPFYVVPGEKIGRDIIDSDRVSWAEKPDIRELENGRFRAIGTELIGINDRRDTLIIPEGITNIFEPYLRDNHIVDDFLRAKRVVYPRSYNGEIVIPKNATDIEIQGEFEKLKFTFGGHDYDYDYKNYELKNIKITGRVKFFDDTWALKHCVNLKELAFPEGLEELGEYAFYWIERPFTVRLPESLQKVNSDQPFNENNKLIVYSTCPALQVIRNLQAERNYNERFEISVIDPPWLAASKSFINRIGLMYSSKKTGDSLQETVATIVRESFSGVDDLSKSRRTLITEAGKANVPRLKAILESDYSDEDLFENLSKLIYQDIIKSIEEENQAKYTEAESLYENGTLYSLQKAESAFNSLGAFKDAADRAKQCTERIDQVKSAEYKKATSLAEEGTIESMEAAITKLDSINPYSDSAELIKKLRETIEKEKTYQSAMSLASDDKPASLKEAKNKFASIDGYKDASEKVAECEKDIEVSQKYYYVNARNTEKTLSASAQRKAISLYRDTLGYDDSNERIGICQKNTESIKEILGLEKSLVSARESASKAKNGVERKIYDEFISNTTKDLEEKKNQLAATVGAETTEVSNEGLLDNELKQINEASEQAGKELGEKIAAAKKKGKKKWIIFGSLLAAIAIMVAIALPDLMKPDLMEHGENINASMHGIEYEVPKDWHCAQLLRTEGAYQYYTLSKDNKVIAAFEVAYLGDTDLSGDAQYDDNTAEHKKSDKAYADLPESAGYYQMVYADESAFEVTIYFNEGAVKNGEQFLESVCQSFKTSEYTNPRQLKNAEVEYTGFKDAETVIDENSTNIHVYAEYDTGIGTGTKQVYDWTLKDPVTLKAGKTSTLTIILDGKEYSTEITCTTKAEEETNEDENDSNTDGSTGRHVDDSVSSEGLLSSINGD